MRDLRDTIEDMQSSFYVDRFRAEYWQTKIRYEKLKKFCTMIEASYDDENVKEPKHDCSLALLKNQQSLMGEYLHVLEVRAVIENVDLEEGCEKCECACDDEFDDEECDDDEECEDEYDESELCEENLEGVVNRALVDGYWYCDGEDIKYSGKAVGMCNLSSELNVHSDLRLFKLNDISMLSPSSVKVDDYLTSWALYKEDLEEESFRKERTDD